MPATSLENEIEKALYARVVAGTYLQKTYPNGVPTLGATLAPSSVKVWPARSRFGEEPHNRQALQHARLEWLWYVEAQWAARVEISPFEDAVNIAPVLVPRDPAAGILQQAELRFLGAAYMPVPRDESPREGASITTHARGPQASYVLWTFEAVLTPYPSPR